MEDPQASDKRHLKLVKKNLLYQKFTLPWGLLMWTRSVHWFFPIVSDSNKLIWVHSKQFDLQLDGASELERAFDRFPYLTQSQTATLAQRCSLHPDQVKVWFMMQILHYGISWDHDDILDVKRKIKRQGLGNEELQKDRGGNKNVKRKVKESGGKKAEEARTEPSPNEGRVTFLLHQYSHDDDYDRMVENDCMF